MHQSVKLTDAIWLLQVAISSTLIHALGDPSQAPTGIWTRVPRPLACTIINDLYFLAEFWGGGFEGSTSSLSFTIYASIYNKLL